MSKNLVFSVSGKITFSLVLCLTRLILTYNSHNLHKGHCYYTLLLVYREMPLWFPLSEKKGNKMA